MDDEPNGRPQAPPGTRVYVGNLPRDVSKTDVEEYFNTNGTGKILEVKLMDGFGFLEYENALDARDVVPNLHGQEFMGNRLTVQFARGARERGPRNGPGFSDRPPQRTRRSIYRMNMSNLPPETSWQDLKDFARLDGLDVVYSEIPRERDGTGFVEYETEADLNTAVSQIDGRDFRGSTIQSKAVIQSERPRDNRYRSRSPPPYRRGGYGAPAPRDHHDDYYERRGPPRPYSTRGYRDRSPPPRRGYYEDRGAYPPPRAGGRGPPPADDYPPPRRTYPADDYPPPPRGGGYGSSRGPPPYEADPYANGSRGGYDRPPSPRRRSPPPPRGGYDRGYDRPQY